MESFFGFIGLAVALFVAFNAKNRVAALEDIVKALKLELTSLRSELAAIAKTRSSAQGQQEDRPIATKVEATSEPSPAISPQADPEINAVGEPIPARRLPVSGAASAAKAGVDTPRAATGIDQQAPAPKTAPVPAPAARPAKGPPVKQASIFNSPLAMQAKQWLFGGNLVAKVGLLILFIGISFGLKYATANMVIPIELRLAGIVLADIALLVWGWRIRGKRPGISLPVQGAAMAILMLVTFGAFRLYDLIPSGMAFALLFVLTAFTCLLAVLQNALWLAIFGIAGGFLAPILTSSGHGSHIGLFSYYALLNAGILGIALRRSWRALNVLGFAFTFIIGTAWGVQKYLPENYASSQFFLILFFLFYVAIALLYASRQAPQLKNYVDGTLVFGTPLVAFGLQFGLVKDTQFGAAFSALVLGLFYMSTAIALWRRRGTSMKLLAESFFALGVVFGTLAIPFALDGRWTSAAWALEGAGIVWIGLRQRQPLAWMFGLLVQAGAWLSFLSSAANITPGVAAQSNLWLGFLLLAATAFLMATNFRKHASTAERTQNASFGPFSTLFLALASIWFVAGAWTEIWLRTSGATKATLLVLTALITASGLGLIARRMQWQVARYFAVAVQLVAGATLFVLAIDVLDWPSYNGSPNLFDSPFLGSLMVGASAMFSAAVFQRQQGANPSLGTLSKALLMWSGFWWFGLVLYSLAGWAATHYQIYTNVADEHDSLLFCCAYGICIALTGPLFALLARRLHWSALRMMAAPIWMALAAATIAMLGAMTADVDIPRTESWAAFAALWLSGEWLLHFWQKASWPEKPWSLKLLHAIRTAGPWLMIWPVGHYWISRWLHGGTGEEERLLAQAGWFTAGSWARYLPAWVMMLVLAWLIARVREGGWPVKPLAHWYRGRLVPLGTAWSVALVIVWNLTQNGSMAPLPYVPLLNPLDLSTCFAILLGIASYRLLRTDPSSAGVAPTPADRAWTRRALYLGAVAAYGWFNLVLLRSAAHFMDIPYQFDQLFASQFVQALLSLVWSASALILMRRAVGSESRKLWMIGAGFLAVVVTKLFFVDLSNVGGLARIVSFVGVGLLMVAIGYVAPYPSATAAKPGPAEPESPELPEKDAADAAT